MHDTGPLSFAEVAAWLFCSLLSSAMILLLLQLVAFTGAGRAPLPAWVLLVAFCGTIAYSCVALVRALFPAWLSAGSSGALVQKIIEIEGRV